MLTPRQNLLETIRGGNPDRFVNQYEFIDIVFSDPYNTADTYPRPGEMNVVDSWGITRSWPAHTPGSFPVHTPDRIVCKDVTRWREQVKTPNMIFSDALWEEAQADMAKIDRTRQFAAPMVAPGLFERCHYLMSIEQALMNMYEEPDDMKDLIKYLTEWELEYARVLCDHLHPDALFHHDDWGSQISTFFSPAMFEDFFLDSYKQIYGYYKSRGVELVVHHSDSYAATLVPHMIEMGIDIWQGVMTTNNVPELIKKYGGQISFMGGINSATVDHHGWNREQIASEVERVCNECGRHYFIPCASIGLPFSTFDGVYETLTEEIERVNRERFGL